MTSKSKKPSQIEKTFKKIGLRDVSTKTQEKNGTRVYFDDDANCNYIFRQFSAPRIEYFSNISNSIQSYKMFEPTGSSIKDDMKEAIPYIINRKLRGVRERAQAAIRIAAAII
jgi:hypothetical protein